MLLPLMMFMLLLRPSSEEELAECAPQCRMCSSEQIFCDKSGLLQLPASTRLIPKVELLNQRFQSPSLSPANFSQQQQSPPRIRHLALRTSNIISIDSFTFSALAPSLRVLDLSEAVELRVSASAFANLRLSLLRIDQTGTLTLHNRSFSQLSTASLSIQNSHLLTLSPELLMPLASSLRSLLLRNNLLRTLDVRLTPVFLQITELNLHGNPFMCDCHILWLSQLLQSHQQRKPSHSSNPLQRPQFPMCVSPQQFRKQFLHTLVGRLSHCAPPIISRIDISFISLQSASVLCLVGPDGAISTGGDKYATDSAAVVWLASNAAHNPLSNPLAVSGSPKQQTFTCKAENRNGLVTLDFQISWQGPNTSTNVMKNTVSLKKVDPNKRRPSQPNIISTETEDNSNYFQKEVFSMFEMIFAIMGTLIITVALFLVICCYFGAKSHIARQKRKKSGLKSYLSYDKGIYTETGVYCDTEMERSATVPCGIRPSTNITTSGHNTTQHHHFNNSLYYTPPLPPATMLPSIPTNHFYN